MDREPFCEPVYRWHSGHRRGNVLRPGGRVLFRPASPQRPAPRHPAGAVWPAANGKHPCSTTCTVIWTHGTGASSSICTASAWTRRGQPAVGNRPRLSRGLRRDHQIIVGVPDRAAFSADPLSVFENIFLDEVWAALEDDHLMLMVDEVARLEEEGRAGRLERRASVPAAPHAALRNLNFIFSLGSGLEEMGRDYAFLFSASQYHRISFLEPAAARALITQPVKSRYQVMQDAVAKILQITSGHPYYTQLVCHSLFDRWARTRSPQLPRQTSGGPGRSHRAGFRQPDLRVGVFHAGGTSDDGWDGVGPASQRPQGDRGSGSRSVAQGRRDPSPGRCRPRHPEPHRRARWWRRAGGPTRSAWTCSGCGSGSTADSTG